MPRKFSRRGRVNSKLQFAQIVGLAFALVMLLMFKDRIAGNAGAFLDAFGPPTQDLKVPDDTVSISDPSDGNANANAGANADMAPDAAAQDVPAVVIEPNEPAPTQPAKNSDK